MSIASPTAPAFPWLDLARDLWPILFGLGQVSWFCLTWWWRKSVVTHADLAKKLAPVIQDVDKLKDAYAALSLQQQHLPTRHDLMRVTGEIAAARGDIRTAVAEMDGNRREIGAQVEGVKGLVDRTERMTQLLTQHLLDQGK